MKKKSTLPFLFFTSSPSSQVDFYLFLVLAGKYMKTVGENEGFPFFGEGLVEIDNSNLNNFTQSLHSFSVCNEIVSFNLDPSHYVKIILFGKMTNKRQLNCYINFLFFSTQLSYQLWNHFNMYSMFIHFLV